MRNIADIIIPCFNDGGRISRVISALVGTEEINKIIVVDDGSKKSTKSVLSKLNGVELVTHLENQGKTAALYTGLKKCTAEVVVFLDADLVGINNEHVKDLINGLSDGVVMVLGQREKENFIGRITGIGVAYTGERVFWRKTLVENMDIFNVTGYLIEPELNKRFFYKNVSKVVMMRGVKQVNKVFKSGLVGLMADFKMFGTFIRYLGIKEFFRQISLGLMRG